MNSIVYAIFCIGFLSLSECQDNETSADTFRLTAIIAPPYLMEVKDGESQDMYDGYLMDVWNKLQETLGIEKHELTLVADGKYGTMNENGDWTGLIAELINDQADAALAPLTVTSKREEFVDFSTPYMEVGGVILVKKDLDIHNTQELMDSDIQYGCISGGSTMAMFQNAQDGVLKEMNDEMTTFGPSVFVKMPEEGAAKAITDDYAFIGEESMLRYLASIHCELKVVAIDAIPTVRHAFALQKDSRFTSEFNTAIESLKSDGTLDSLYEKWWDVKQSECMEKDEHDSGMEADPKSEPNSDEDDDSDENSSIILVSNISALVLSLVFTLSL